MSLWVEAKLVDLEMCGCCNEVLGTGITMDETEKRYNGRYRHRETITWKE